MTVEFEEAETTPETIFAAVKKAGYGAAPLSESRMAAAPTGGTPIVSAHAERNRLIWSIVFLIPLFYIGMGHMLNIFPSLKRKIHSLCPSLPSTWWKRIR